MSPPKKSPPGNSRNGSLRDGLAQIKQEQQKLLEAQAKELQIQKAEEERLLKEQQDQQKLAAEKLANEALQAEATPDDPAELFRRAVGDVKPMQDDKVLPAKSDIPAIPRQTQEDERAVMREAMSDERHPDELDTGEFLSWRREGVQNRVMKKLRSGHYAIQHEVDLHGLTVAETRELLSEFIDHASNTNQSCCVRIIHGKGISSIDKGPRLKPFVSSWLRQRRHVIAFCSCKPAHGGTGAVYVLLQRGVSGSAQ